MTVAESILNKVKNIPRLSKGAVQLMKVVGDPDHTIDQVVKIIETDTALTALVLKKVNSASYGLVQEVSSISRAITYLGDKMVENIAVSSCAPQVFEKELDGYESGKTALWEHSLRTAIAARELAGKAEHAISPDVAFTAGLLHDIGKAVTTDFMSDALPLIQAKIDSRAVEDFLEGEQALLGTNHCTVGAALAEEWNLPVALVQAISFHHNPEQADEAHRGLVYAVHLGDVIAMLGGSGTNADTLQYEINQSYTDYIPLDLSEQSVVMLTVATEFQKTMALLKNE